MYIYIYIYIYTYSFNLIVASETFPLLWKETAVDERQQYHREQIQNISLSILPMGLQPKSGLYLLL
jgi:hypothetical protein